MDSSTKEQNNQNNITINVSLDDFLASEAPCVKKRKPKKSRLDYLLTTTPDQIARNTIIGFLIEEIQKEGPLTTNQLNIRLKTKIGVLRRSDGTLYAGGKVENMLKGSLFANRDIFNLVGDRWHCKKENASIFIENEIERAALFHEQYKNRRKFKQIFKVTHKNVDADSDEEKKSGKATSIKKGLYKRRKKEHHEAYTNYKQALEACLEKNALEIPLERIRKLTEISNPNRILEDYRLLGVLECYNLFRSLFWDKEGKLIEAQEDVNLRLEEKIELSEISAKRLLEEVVKIETIL